MPRPVTWWSQGLRLGVGVLGAWTASLAAMVINPVDAAFGVAIVEFPRGNNGATAELVRIAVAPGGRVLALVAQATPDAGGPLCTSLTVLAFDAQGHPDPGFAGNGRATGSALGVPGCVQRTGLGLAVTASGALLLTATGGAADALPRVYRVTADGRPDATFGGGAGVSLPRVRTLLRPTIVARPDGRIAIGGTAMVDDASGAAFYALAVAMLRADGTVDSAYGEAGVALAVPPNRPLYGADGGGLAFTTEGSALVAGNIYEDNSGPRLYLDATVVRFDAAGRLDRTYGTGGFAIPLADASTYAQALAVVDGEAYLAGVQNRDVPYAFVVKIRATGQVDNAFGSGGVVGTDRFRDNDGHPQVAVDAGRRVTMTIADARGRVRVLRFTRDGQVDATFGLQGGAAIAADGFAMAGPTSLALSADGRLHLGEGAFFGTDDLAHTAIGVTRLREDGGHRDGIEGGRAIVYYHATLGHYFMTANPAEQTALDSGATTGWSRTGDAFAVVTSPAIDADLAEVCRYYGRPEAHLDSHFFSAAADECAAVAQKFSASWQLETPAAFAVHLPDRATGACPRGSERIYRAFNGRADANHFYGTLAAAPGGWIYEGYGPGPLPTAFCAPLW